MKEDSETENLAEEDWHEHHRFTVDPGQEPVRIDKFIVDRITSKVSRNRIQQAIKAGAVTVDGELVKSNLKVQPGMVITIMMNKPVSEGKVIPENIPLDIRYEDDHLMIIHKPPGLVVHPGIGIDRGTLVNGIAYYFDQIGQEYRDRATGHRPGLVHRIDKNTSGLLVIAKTEAAHTLSLIHISEPTRPY